MRLCCHVLVFAVKVTLGLLAYLRIAAYLLNG